ncbi:hypothetical protein C8Q80DRAFT_537525 [Daedaleopsis nitida]|nr:hypothetical protein C8Q80DRAFT_537525 [Daedaleopsis nitida]
MSRSPSPVIQRASRTYGRRRNPDPDTSFEIADISMSSREDPDSSMSLSVDHEFPPPSDDVDATNASPASEHASKASDDDDDDKSSGDGDSRYQWSWLKGLKAIDNEDFESKISGQTPLNDTMGGSTRPVSPSDRDREASSVFGGSLSSLPSSSRSPSTFTRPRESNTLPASDPEFDTRPSTPESSPPHRLGTPQSHLSPTPPTSIEMPPTKGKGKERATVHPLRFDNDEQSASNPKLLKQTTTQTRKPKGFTSGAKRVKAPTKKEREETTKATARIAANQQASIAPVHNVSKFSISSLQKRVSSAASAIPQVVGKRLRSLSPNMLSDPIQTSSPRAEDHPVRRARTSASRASVGTSFVSNGLLAEIALDSEDSSGSEDMPNFEDLHKADQKKRSLQEFKQRLVQTAQPPVDGDDSDLEIVDDQKSVVQDVAQSRRGMMARGELPTTGTKKQLAAAGPSARRKIAPLLANNTMDVQRTLRAAALPAFDAKKGAAAPRLTTNDLNKMLWSKAEENSLQTIRQKEQEWQRQGGEIKQQPGQEAGATGLPSLSEIVHQRREALEKKHALLEVADDSGSDHEWKPGGNDEMEDGEASGSDEEEQRQSPAALDPDDQADDEDEDDENVFLVKRPLVRPPRARPIMAIESDDEDDAENRPPSQPNRSRTLVRDASWANTVVPAEVADNHALGHRGSISSLGDTTDSARTEDGTDKENDARLSYPRGEDKENTAVAIQTPVSSMSLHFNRSFGSLFAAENPASPSGSVGRGAGPSGVRSPLQELPADDDDPFGPSLQLAGPRMGRLSPEPSLNLGEGCDLQPAFSLSVKGKGKERERSPSPSSFGDALHLGGGLGGGGFSQFVTQEGNARGFDQLKAAQDDDDIALTADTGLQPTLDISSTFRRKADEIFEKEQEHIAQQESSNIQNDSAPEMFVDENG